MIASPSPPGVSDRARPRQMQQHRLPVPRRPRCLGDPAARPLGIGRRRPHAFLHPGAQHRLVHDAGVDALQPVIPPAQRLLQEADLRARLRHMRIGMRPWPDQALLRAGQAGQQARNGIGVAVRPAADGIDGRGDGGIVLADRALLPVVVARAGARSSRGHQRVVLEPLQPHVAPALADHLGVRRLRAEGEHGRGPGDACC